MDTVKSITVRDYRCFAGSQTARLAPLTLLVGDNSTGKTSLMAMLRAMLEAAYTDRVPDFKEPPYDLGSFAEIAYKGGARGNPPDEFGATLEVVAKAKSGMAYTVATDVDFVNYRSAPVPKRRRVSQGEYWAEQRFSESGETDISYGSPRGAWAVVRHHYVPLPLHHTHELQPMDFTLWLVGFVLENEHATESPLEERFQPMEGSPPISHEDLSQIGENLRHTRRGFRFEVDSAAIRRVFASAPVRSQPKRTYDPALATPDPEGDYVPMYLAQLALREPETWDSLKRGLQEFGNQAGLFDEINVHRPGRVESASFQIRIRKSGKRRRGPLRNLVDMGYGVSQVLPLITELLRQDGPRLMLLQQPEVHLHPSAAAALGSLFCEIVAASKRRGNVGRQIVVETHSDFIIDRVRMAVRDETSDLQPEEVSILYFKREEQAVQIHSISVDRLGNIEGAPVGYRQFFLDELRRSMSA